MFVWLQFGRVKLIYEVCSVEFFCFSNRDMRIGAPWFGKLAPLNLYSDSFRQHKLFRWFLKHEDIVKKQKRWQDYFIKLFCAGSLPYNHTTTKHNKHNLPLSYIAAVLCLKCVVNSQPWGQFLSLPLCSCCLSCLPWPCWPSFPMLVALRCGGSMQLSSKSFSVGNWYQYTQTPTPHLNKAYSIRPHLTLSLSWTVVCVSQALLISPGAGFLAMASYVPEEEEEVAALNSDWTSESFEGDLNLNGNEEDSLLE